MSERFDWFSWIGFFSPDDSVDQRLCGTGYPGLLVLWKPDSTDKTQPPHLRWVWAGSWQHFRSHCSFCLFPGTKVPKQNPSTNLAARHPPLTEYMRHPSVCATPFKSNQLFSANNKVMGPFYNTINSWLCPAHFKMRRAQKSVWKCVLNKARYIHRTFVVAISGDLIWMQNTLISI